MSGWCGGPHIHDENKRSRIWTRLPPTRPLSLPGSMRIQKSRYRVRLGQYRVIYCVCLDKREVVILKVSVSGKAYSSFD